MLSAAEQSALNTALLQSLVQVRIQDVGLVGPDPKVEQINPGVLCDEMYHSPVALHAEAPPLAPSPLSNLIT